MKTHAVYHGFEIEVDVLEIDPPSAVGGYTITVSDPLLEERLRRAVQPLSWSIPTEAINLPGDVDMAVWPAERFLEMARIRIDDILADLPI